MDLIRVSSFQELPAAFGPLGVGAPRPVLVLVGAANSLNAALAGRLLPLFSEVLVPLLDELGAVAIDGGTDSGVMALLGRARRLGRARFPLLGVAATGTLAPPVGTDPEGANPNPDHSAHLLVPGSDWGDEIPWMNALASAIAGDRLGVTLAIGGGGVTERDLAASLAVGRATFMLADTGPLADRLAEDPLDGLQMIPFDEAARFLESEFRSRWASSSSPGGRP